MNAFGVVCMFTLIVVVAALLATVVDKLERSDLDQTLLTFIVSIVFVLALCLGFWFGAHLTGPLSDAQRSGGVINATHNLFLEVNQT